MVLRKKRAVSVDGIPVELLDEDHPSWGGLLLPHRQAAEAYAIEQGWVRFYGDNTRPFVDLNKMAEVGIPMAGSARLRRERHPNLNV